MKFSEALNKGNINNLFNSSFAAVPNCNFIVLFMGGIVGGFTKVTNIVKEINYETIQEGGKNDSPVYLIKPMDKEQNITFTNCVGMVNIGTLGGDIFGAVIRQPVPTLIFILDGKKEIKKAVAVKKPFPVKWKTGDLNALQSELLVEEITFIHEGLIEIPLASLIGKGMDFITNGVSGLVSSFI